MCMTRTNMRTRNQDGVLKENKTMGASSDYVVYKKVSGVLKELGNEKGELSKIKSSEYTVKDLHKKTLLELEELLARQKAILKNRAFLSKLPDKGEKLKLRCQEIEKAYNEVISKSGLQNGIEKDSVTKCDSTTINAFEWTKNIVCSKETENESDRMTSSSYVENDEIIDPLELLATHSSDVPTRKVLRFEEEDPAAVVAKELSQLDINENQSTSETKHVGSPALNFKDSESMLEFSVKLLKSLDLKEKMNPVRKHFKPFRPLKNSLSEMKQSRNASTNSKKASSTELFETINSPPAKLIPLQESLRLLGESQKRENDHLHTTTEYALTHYPRTDIGLPLSTELHYRDSNCTAHILEDSDEEDYDGGGIINELSDGAESEND